MEMKCYGCRKTIYRHEAEHGLYLLDCFFRQGGDGFIKCQGDSACFIQDDLHNLVSFIKSENLQCIQGNTPDGTGIGHVIVCPKCVKRLAKAERISLKKF